MNLPKFRLRVHSLSLSLSSFPSRESVTRVINGSPPRTLSDFIEWTKVIVFSTRPIRIVYHEYKRGRGEKGGEGRGLHSPRPKQCEVSRSSARFHPAIVRYIRTSTFFFFLFLLFFFFFSFD